MTPGAADSGVYLLVLRLSTDLSLSVGKLGHLSLPAGDYAYAGSARRGLAARLARHCRRRKSLCWHIDFLTSRAQPLGALTWPWRRGRECRLARAVEAAQLGSLAVPRFGASDCRCRGHLLALHCADLSALARQLRSAVGGEPGRIALGSTQPGHRGSRHGTDARGS